VKVANARPTIIWDFNHAGRFRHSFEANNFIRKSDQQHPRQNNWQNQHIIVCEFGPELINTLGSVLHSFQAYHSACEMDEAHDYWHVAV